MRLTTLSAAAILTCFTLGEAIAADTAPAAAAPASLSHAIPSGSRAFSIVVDAASGLAAGDNVDIIFVHNIAQDIKANATGSSALHENLRPAVSEVLMANIVVLSSQSGAPGIITLQVMPGQAQQLAIAQKLGTLSAVLRATADAGKNDVPAATSIKELGRLQGAQEQMKEEPVKVVRGRAGK